MKRFLVTLALLGLVACAPPATIVTPQGKIAYTADQIANRIGEFQNAVIQADQAKAIPDSTAVPLVQFSVAAEKTLGSTPSGWQATVLTAWTQAKKAIPAADAQKLAVVIGSVDAVLAAFGGQ